MNAPASEIEQGQLGCRDLALAAFGALLQAAPPQDAPEARFLHEAWQRAGGADWPQQVAHSLAMPPAHDALLIRAAEQLQLQPVEVLAMALAAAVEDDPLVGRLMAWLQAPVASARPSLALLARAFAPLCASGRSDAQAEAETLYALAFGAAVRSGALLLDADDRPLCERGLRIQAPLAAALAGIETDWPGAPGAQPAGADGLDADALDRWAKRLAASDGAGLLIRSASTAEAQAVAAALAARLGVRPAWWGRELPPGADLWMSLGCRLPVFLLPAAPGEVVCMPPLRHHTGPVLVLAGLDGSIRRDDGVLAEWRVPRATLAVREALWRDALGDSPAATQAARRYRAAPAQAAEHARLAQLLVAGEAANAGIGDRIAQAARLSSACRALEALAMPLPEPVCDQALVVADGVRAELQRVLQRCEQRETLHERLGAAARTRACEGVRLLFTGASGTGKSLAAQWLASRLGLPIYRVDLSSMLSKWIGETEKNLAELLARAEHADVLLLFDEADALFGKRTEVASANDRFANAQTNYLLQRIETHGGIVVLTANSRSRFDPAFARRLDFIVDFSAPDAQARRELWRMHLGEASDCDDAAINRLAARVDLAGGNIRNAVLAAAASAGSRGEPIGIDDIGAGVRAEFRKLGRTPQEF
ncbi:ATP-binding protein [Piscinibacter sakaiensis]|uniref:ATP-binding protein n=1 Tax=Piscinibacter sakaiensis TaxID=1547922 RepID=UPI003AAF5375